MKSFTTSKLSLKAFALAFTLSLLTACGGGSDGEETAGNDGGGEGGIIGTAKIIVKSDDVKAKAKNGNSYKAKIGKNGKYKFTKLKSGSYLLRSESKTRQLYSVAYVSKGKTATSNVHPITDLIIRNWFKQNGQDIDAQFKGAGAIAKMPSLAEINKIETAIEGILAQALKQSGVKGSVNLIGNSFEVKAGDTFNTFLTNNQVIINNNQVTLIFTGDKVQTISISGKGLETDFTADKENPTTPTELRALPSGTHEIVVVWKPSTDDRGVAGYNIYRNGSLVATTPYPVYTDKKLSQGTNYDYMVEAIDGVGKKSGKAISDAVTTLSAPDKTPPPAIANLSATANDDDVALRWDITQVNDIARFIVKRGLRGMAKSELASITANTFTDFNLNDGNYCYSITAADAAGNKSAESAEQCALINAGGTTPSETRMITCTSYSTLQNTTINKDTTLNAGCYKVDSDIYIENAATLTVKPGTLLQFASGKLLRVRSNGALNAEGTLTAPIIFTGESKTPGFWNGITYYGSNNNSNSLKYVTIEYAGGSYANLNIDYGTRIKLSHSIIRKSSKYGVKFSSSSIIDNFASNILTENSGAPVRIPANKVHKLDKQSSYTGNAIKRDFISIYESSKIVDDQAWSLLNVPYKLHNNSLEALLTIEAGTTLIFKQGGNFKIESNGTLIAKGTANKRITFTGENKTSGSWHGLQFTFSGTANELNYVNVEYAGGENGNGNGAVTLFSTPGRLKISNTVISDSLQYGLDIANSKHMVEISNVTFNNTEDGSVLINPNLLEKLDKNSTYNAPIVWSNDNIESDITIKNLGVPYYVDAHTIRSSVNIEAGTTLSFVGGGGFRIDSGTGSLSAIGTSNSPIIFTGRQKVQGYWKGLEFFSNSFANKLDNTIVEYAGAPGGNTQGLVGVFFNDSRVDVTNSILRHSATNGLWLFDNTTGNHTGNTFENILNKDIFIDN